MLLPVHEDNSSDEIQPTAPATDTAYNNEQ